MIARAFPARPRFPQQGPAPPITIARIPPGPPDPSPSHGNILQKMPVPGGLRYDERPAGHSQIPAPIICTTSLCPENPILRVDVTPPGIPRYGNTFFLLLNAYGYSRPRLSGRDIITQQNTTSRSRTNHFIRLHLYDEKRNYF